MKEPRLIIMSGAKRGTIARLSGSEMTIGRDSMSGLCMSEESISRKHCAVLSDGDRYRIVDFNSRNGTFVNGIPIREKALLHGDTIRLGASELLFLVEEEAEEENELAPAVDHECTIVVSRTQLRVGLSSTVPDIGTLVRDLDVLLKLSRRINTIDKVDTLQRELLEIALDVVPAERAFVIVSSRGGDLNAIGLHHDGRKASPQELNWKIVNRALWETANIVNEPEAAKKEEGTIRWCFVSHSLRPKRRSARYTLSRAQMLHSARAMCSSWVRWPAFLPLPLRTSCIWNPSKTRTADFGGRARWNRRSLGRVQRWHQ